MQPDVLHDMSYKYCTTPNPFYQRWESQCRTQDLYHLQCSICIALQSTPFLTNITLGDRFGEHRLKYYQLINNPDTDSKDDEFSPGLHLVECHSATTPEAFNEIYKVFIVDVCSPKTLEVREHKHIHELKTLKPFA